MIGDVDVRGIWQMIANFMNRVFNWLIFILNGDLNWGDVTV